MSSLIASLATGLLCLAVWIGGGFVICLFMWVSAGAEQEGEI